MSDKFEMFNMLAKKILAEPDIDYRTLNNIFREIEKWIIIGIHDLVKYSTFVEDNICYSLFRIAAGAVKNEKYGVYDSKNKGFIEINGNGNVTIGSGNLHVLSVGYNLFRLSELDRFEAEPQTKKVLSKLNLRNNRYEAILRTFISITADYRSTELHIAELKSILSNTDDQKSAINLMQRISTLTDKKRLIEQRVGAAYPVYLYGIVAKISTVVDKISKLQNKIVKSYMKLVLAETRKFAHSDLHAGDIFQAGSFGLWRAVSDYDYNQRMTFPTFAKQWIIQRIQAYRKSSGGPLIKVAPSTWKTYQKIRSAINKLSTDLNIFDPSDRAIAEEIGCTVEKVTETLKEIQISQVVSYDQDQNEDAEWKEVSVYNDNTLYQEHNEITEEHRSLILGLLQGLTKDERMVICLRNGLVSGIDNSGIMNKKETLSVILQQLSYKVNINRILAGRLDRI